MIEHNDLTLNVKRKCELLNIPRSTNYYKPAQKDDDRVMLMNEIREIYQGSPFFGYRKILVELRRKGYLINHKRLQKLLKLAGIQAIYPKKKTTIMNKNHKIYPYLLKGLKIEKPNQVWQVDITYIKIKQGFVYLVCLIDIFSRRIMGWALSIFLDTNLCLEALGNAITHDIPEIINSDQGCQFTSEGWINFLNKNSIMISMDGKGRWIDNIYVERLWRSIKYENVYLHSFDTVFKAREAIARYIEFYNNRRPHQALNYHTPDEIFKLKTIPSKQFLFEELKLQNLNNTSWRYA
jgi:putative transposase